MALLVHLLVTWTLVGLIWQIQVVQYPLFHQVGRETFQAYHFGHCLRIGLSVVPLMLAEALTAGWLVYAGERQPVFLASLVLMAGNWLSTAVYQAPIHTRLMGGYSEPEVHRLVRTNWLRTLGWTARGVMVAWVVSRKTSF